MPWYSALMIFFIIWWITLFAILPIGVKGQAEEDNVVQGSERGAPVDPQLKRKFIMTTIVAAIIWIIVFVVISFHWIDPARFYDTTSQ